MKEGAKFLGCGVVVWVVVLGLVLASSVGIWLLRVEFADEIGKGNAEIQLESAPYRIQAYEHFFNKCVEVQNAEISIDAQTDLLATTTDATEKSRINTNISALHSQRGMAINAYNADALKDYTQAQFRDSNLPYQLPTAQYEVGGPKTLCASS